MVTICTLTKCHKHLSQQSHKPLTVLIKKAGTSHTKGWKTRLYRTKIIQSIELIADMKPISLFAVFYIVLFYFFSFFYFFLSFVGQPGGLPNLRGALLSGVTIFLTKIFLTVLSHKCLIIEQVMEIEGLFPLTKCYNHLS